MVSTTPCSKEPQDRHAGLFVDSAQEEEDKYGDLRPMVRLPIAPTTAATVMSARNNRGEKGQRRPTQPLGQG